MTQAKQKLHLLYSIFGAVRWFHLFDDDVLKCYHDEIHPLLREAEIAHGATEHLSICVGCKGLHDAPVLYEGFGIHDRAECRAAVDKMREDAQPLTIEEIKRLAQEIREGVQCQSTNINV
ncbi:MAG: hypothetical protein GY832_26275 [Chloroflexi bacterium]|nr:hypothetical protein [Chloroflexota bacterium]